MGADTMKRRSDFLLETLAMASMCRVIMLGAVLTAAGLAAAADSVEFDGQSLLLASQAAENDESIQEFIPKDETIDAWTKLAAIRTQGGIDDPAAMAKEMATSIRKRYPKAPFKVMVNKKAGEAMIDFVVWPEDGSFAEFNVFRYAKHPRDGLASQQYALRAYGDDALEFLKGLRPVRERLVTAMALSGLTRDGVGLEGFDPVDEFRDWEEIRFASRLRDSDPKDPGDESVREDLLEDADDDESEDGEDLSDDDE
jgi:hypothetical protein